MKINREFLRTVRGQLSLLAAAYVGALVLALAALCLRSLFFERFVHDKFAPVPERLQTLAADLAAGRGDPGQLRALSSEDVNLIYGAWLDQPDLDPAGRLARDLLTADGARILERVRRTLVAGNPAQRARAVELLGLVDVAELKPEVCFLCDYAARKAQRRGEAELAGQADAVLDRLAR